MLKIIISVVILFFIVSCTEHDPFKEYKKKEFKFNGRNAKIVFPHKVTEGNNWIWRARFWGHEPQVDLALLEKGFHLVYIDVIGLYGNDEAVEIWNKYYDFLTKEYNLNNKVVLEGMSRGGLNVYNWASQNTDKVACIYADAPVCDIKSWPGGLYKGKGSPKEWKELLSAYKLDEKSVLEYKNIPIYNAIEVAKAHIPVIHVCGMADDVVPYDENTGILAENFKKAGGKIELILKDGVGHHPHSLKDPTPIVSFILANTAKKQPY